MKIERAYLYHLRMELQTPFATSFGSISTRECVLVEVISNGLTGFGECPADRDPGYSYETCGTAWHILKDFILPAVVKKEIGKPGLESKPLDIALALQSQTSFVRGHHMAKAGLEMALWDLIGKAQHNSLARMFGGVRKRVEVGVSVGLQDSAQALAYRVAEYVEQGYGRVKIKIKPGRDVEDTRAIRLAFPSLRLQVDANSAYLLDSQGENSAAKLLPLDDFGLLLIEQPLAEDDLWDHRKLQAQLRTPICLDESITSLRHARQALEMKACRVINIKPGRVGGLSQALAIHDLCNSQDIPVWCGGMLETGVGRASNLAIASLPGFTLPGDISATDRYYAEDITHERFSLNPDSTIDVPQGAGLGVEINRKALEKVTLASCMID